VRPRRIGENKVLASEKPRGDNLAGPDNKHAFAQTALAQRLSMLCAPPLSILLLTALGRTALANVWLDQIWSRFEFWGATPRQARILQKLAPGTNEQTPTTRLQRAQTNNKQTSAALHEFIISCDKMFVLRKRGC
jgi:hypothetical protein